jgi:hypothetical protein
VQELAHAAVIAVISDKRAVYLIRAWMLTYMLTVSR